MITFLGCDSSWVDEIALLSQISQGEVFTEDFQVVEPIDAALSNDSVKAYAYSHHCSLSIIILTLKFNLFIMKINNSLKILIN